MISNIFCLDLWTSQNLFFFNLKRELYCQQFAKNIIKVGETGSGNIVLPKKNIEIIPFLDFQREQKCPPSLIFCVICHQ